MQYVHVSDNNVYIFSNIAVTCMCWLGSAADTTQAPARLTPPQTGKRVLFKRASEGP